MYWHTWVLGLALKFRRPGNYLLIAAITSTFLGIDVIMMKIRDGLLSFIHLEGNCIQTTLKQLCNIFTEFAHLESLKSPYFNPSNPN